ncbi:class I SAM-dependent methyltransferase [Rhodococcus spelaei]|uniref:Class I SAM-dependent methyltransferase n=1 Tax=Rhodococcus spelaei TaxID=2546320 RepID=A0A541BNP1_9NOCA|nr:class I SAM-dependent methyltransferase [Rhodococcus spelaei]TQF73947.1 class I SAM-dependent methyltransferase [Rhodococcus spelaei]
MGSQLPICAKNLNRVPGWFWPLDQALFRVFLAESRRIVGRGDLAEIGTYFGKSAILIGSSLAPGETFTVVDLFGSPADDIENNEENARNYGKLTEQRFRSKYLEFHDSLPVIVHGSSSIIANRASHGTHRFVHVDGSHLYEHVKTDVESTRTLSAPQGVVVFDDIRSEHTPGVPAAVWAAIDRGLNPIALSPAKLYATWGDPRPWVRFLDTWSSEPNCEIKFHTEIQRIAGQSVYRFSMARSWITRKLIELDSRRH